MEAKRVFCRREFNLNIFIEQMVWYKWYGTNAMVQMVWYKWYGKYGMVQMVWYKWYGTNDMVQMVWYKWYGTNDKHRKMQFFSRILIMVNSVTLLDC